MFSGRELYKNLVKDKCFENNDTLDIIDNYNIYDIDETSTNFYINNLKSTGIKHINIYYSVKEYNINSYLDNEELEKLKLDKEYIIALLGFVKCNQYKNIHSKSTLNAIKKSIIFIEKLQKIDISVTLIPYYIFTVKPSFHGRYWFAGNVGYIVDASLNTYSHGAIFAQKMDKENSEIIKKILEEKIVNNDKNLNLKPVDVTLLELFFEALKK